MKHSIIQNRIRQICIIGIWLIVWQIAYLGVGKDILIPSPINTGIKLFQMMQEKIFYRHVASTIYRVCLGVAISFAAGLLAALISYFNKTFEAFLKPLVTIMKSTPVMAIIILALLWFNSSNVPIFVCFLMCFPVGYTNILVGFGSVDESIIEVTKVFRVKLIHVIKDIYIPHVGSYIKSALNLSVGVAWKVVIAAEVLSVPKYSMGYNLLNAKVYLETDEVFAWIIVIVILSTVFEKLVTKILEGKRRDNDDTSQKSL